MTPLEIRARRKELKMSAPEFDSALGYATGGRITKALEDGERNGRPFEMTGTAELSLNRLTTIKTAYEALENCQYTLAYDILRESLPERLR